MSYQLTLNIAEDSAANRNIERVAGAEHLSHEEAALKLIEAPARREATVAHRIVGAFREESALMDEALEIALEDRERRNAHS